MVDGSNTEQTSSPLREIPRKGRVLWWTVDAVLTIALLGVIWLLLSDWFLPLGLGTGVLFALALWKLPQWQVGSVKDLEPKERFDRENEARKTLATILGGAAVLAGGYVTLQNLKVAQHAASISQEALKVSREGQIADRFEKAIEQLGAVNVDGKKKLEVRLGGIYALEGIANESEGLHWPIMEELCTYVRENAPLKPQESTREQQAPAQHTPLAADIQAILTVVGRRDHKYERENQVLDLRGTDLSRANLRGAYISGADLSETDLSGADLRGASLRGANLSQTDLGGGAILGGADLSGANLSRTNLLRADLGGANLRRANLRGADLSGANLSGTILLLANLSGADLRRANNLTQQQIDAAKGDRSTLLPGNLRMPESWK